MSQYNQCAKCQKPKDEFEFCFCGEKYYTAGNSNEELEALDVSNPSLDARVSREDVKSSKVA